MRADEIRRAVLPRFLRKIQVGLNQLPHPKPLRKPGDQLQAGPGGVGFLLELDLDFWYALSHLLGASLVRGFSLSQKQTTPRRLSLSMDYQTPLPNSFNPFLLVSEIWVQRWLLFGRICQNASYGQAVGSAAKGLWFHSLTHQEKFRYGGEVGGKEMKSVDFCRNCGDLCNKIAVFLVSGKIAS